MFVPDFQRPLQLRRSPILGPLPTLSPRRVIPVRNLFLQVVDQFMPVRYSQQVLAQLVDAAAYLVPRGLDRRENHPTLGLELRAQCVIGDVHGTLCNAVLGVRAPILIPRLGRREHDLGCSHGIEIRFGDQLVLASGCLNVLDRPPQPAVHDVGVEAFTLGPSTDRFPDLFPQLPFLRRSTPGVPEELHQLAGGTHSNCSEGFAQCADCDGCQRVHQIGPPHHRHELHPPSSTPVEPVPVSRPTRRPRQKDCPTGGAAGHVCRGHCFGCPLWHIVGQIPGADPSRQVVDHGRQTRAEGVFCRL